MRSTAEVLPGSGYPALGLHIGGEWRTALDAGAIEVLDPSTGEAIGVAPAAGPAQVDEAITEADAAWGSWRAMAPAARGEVLAQAGRLLSERSSHVAGVIARELGKPLAQCAVEVDTAVGILRWNAEEGRRSYGRVIPASGAQRQMALREPYGPVAAFAPWNAPLITPTRKISSALAAGCTVVIKPAEETPGAAVCLVQALSDAGVPPGAVNLVLGNPPEVSRQLITDPRIRAMTFTGSTAVGRSLAALAGHHLTPAVMELGGHAPVIVCRDADVARVAAGAAVAAYRNGGQVCTSPTRFLVERTVYDHFVDELGRRVARLRVGGPFEPDVDIGPLATAERVASIEALVQDAVAAGATLVAGGGRIDRPGYFWRPALLADVPDSAAISSTEPFAPVATVRPIDTLEEAIAVANAPGVGLAGYLFTDSSSAQAALLAGLDCGAISVNHWQVSGPETPFGGHRDSGFGSEGGIEGIAAFQQTKFVSVQ